MTWWSMPSGPERQRAKAAAEQTDWEPRGPISIDGVQRLAHPDGRRAYQSPSGQIYECTKTVSHKAAYQAAAQKEEQST